VPRKWAVTQENRIYRGGVTLGSLCTNGAHRAVENPDALGFEASRAEPSIADWHYLLSSSYERMSDLALEVSERGGIDVEYGESLKLLLFAEADLDQKGSEAQMAPYIRAGGVETGWLERDRVRTHAAQAQAPAGDASRCVGSESAERGPPGL